MAQRYFISASRTQHTKAFGQRRSKYDHLLEPIRALEPNGALFVAYERPRPGDEIDPGSAVFDLKRGLLARFRGEGVTFVEDLRRQGVWVYRPALRGMGGGRAVGPDKEDEIRSRPLD